MNSHKTAITRNKLSLPAQWFSKHLYGRVLDFGCGKGSDSFTLNTERYDPRFFKDKPEGVFDCVMVIYVLNTVVYPESVLKWAKEYVKEGGLIMVATRTVNEIRRCAEHGKWIPQSGGYVTSKDTFQRGIDCESLTAMVGWGEPIWQKSSPFSGVIIQRR